MSNRQKIKPSLSGDELMLQLSKYDFRRGVSKHVFKDRQNFYNNGYMAVAIEVQNVTDNIYVRPEIAMLCYATYRCYLANHWAEQHACISFSFFYVGLNYSQTVVKSIWWWLLL